MTSMDSCQGAITFYKTPSRYYAIEVGEGTLWLKKSMLKAIVFQPMCHQRGLWWRCG